MRIVKIYAGMIGEFEILRTDATDDVLHQYIKACSDNTLPDNDPVLFFKKHGCSVEFLACQHDDEADKINADVEIDSYLLEG